MAKGRTVPRRSRRGRRAKGRMSSGGVFTFTRRVLFNQPKLAGDSGGYASPKVSDFLNSDILSMFQNYKVNSITYKFRLVNAPNNNADFPTLYIAPIKFYSSVNPTARDEIITLGGGQTYQFGPSNVQFSISTKPTVNMSALAVGAGNCQTQSPWIDTVSNGVYHNAFGYWISRYNSTSSPTHTIEVEIVANISCRGAK